MEVVEKSKDGLHRVYHVTFSSRLIGEQVDDRLKKICEKTKLDGFRAGKATFDVVKHYYYNKALADQLEENTRKSVNEIVKQFRVDYTLQPKINPEYDENSGDFLVKVGLEVLPEVKIPDFSNLEVTIYKVKVGEEDINKSLEEFKKSFPNWITASNGESIKNGHLVEFSCATYPHKKSEKPQKFSDAKAVIGHNEYGQEFDNNIRGKKVGDKVQFTIKLPKGHKFAEMKVDYRVTIKRIKLRSEFKSIEDLVKSTGKTEEQVKSSVSKDIEANYTDISWLEVKRRVLDWLAKKCDFDVPQRIVDDEFEKLWTRAQELAPKGKKVSEKEEKNLRQEYEDIAKRRTKLGFMLSEVGKTNKISVQPVEIKNAIDKSAKEYGMDSKTMYKYCMSNNSMFNGIKVSVFEDKVIRFIVSKAKTIEAIVTPTEVRKFSKENVREGA
ncbi:MAG: trigger factor [Holosporales bacterium]|jgi:trigger factor|nr:trigger factor [Holosporales bacterium]